MSALNLSGLNLSAINPARLKRPLAVLLILPLLAACSPDGPLLKGERNELHLGDYEGRR
jgi:hypothetical protein